MKKNEILILLVILLIAGGIFGYTRLSAPKVEEGEVPKIVVLKDSTAVKIIDPSVDGEYEFHGNYGVFHVLVQDGKWCAHDVECPTQECVGVGWVDFNDYWPIVCIPNGYSVIRKE